MPLRTVLERGQTVQIVTSGYANPDPRWLYCITTAKARHTLIVFLNDLTIEQTNVLGKRLVSNELNYITKKQRNINKNAI